MAMFEDRSDAGRRLARLLAHYADRNDVLILALPRGGVQVAGEAATALHVPMDIILVRKLGVPGYEELAMGAITASGVRIINESVVRSLGISQAMIDATARRQQQEIRRQEQVYRQEAEEITVKGKIIILIDDGLATGASMRAAVESVRQQHPRKIVVAVPIGAAETCEEFKNIADEIICYATPDPFYGVGAWYRDFSQLSDEDVRNILQAAQDNMSSIQNLKPK